MALCGKRVTGKGSRSAWCANEQPGGCRVREEQRDRKQASTRAPRSWGLPGHGRAVYSE